MPRCTVSCAPLALKGVRFARLKNHRPVPRSTIQEDEHVSDDKLARKLTVLVSEGDGKEAKHMNEGGGHPFAYVAASPEPWRRPGASPAYRRLTSLAGRLAASRVQADPDPQPVYRRRPAERGSRDVRWSRRRMASADAMGPLRTSGIA